MLEIQKFLRSHSPKSALSKAAEKFKLDVSEEGDLVQLNYGMDSPRGIPETDECRGLILEKPSWRLVAYPFYRFYNAHEGFAASLDLNTSSLMEKLDGTLITMYPYKGEIKVATRGMVFAHGSVGPARKGEFVEFSFADLFWKTVRENYSHALCSEIGFLGDTCIMFELTTPENRVVTPYFSRGLHLLAARCISDDWKELDPNELDALSFNMGIPRPKVYEFKNADHINSMISMLPTLEEGFVLVDFAQMVRGSFARIKIKNPQYLAAAHLLGSNFNPKRVLEVILKDAEDEFISYFPEYKDTFVKVRVAFEELAFQLQQEYDAIKHLCSDPKNREQKKVFAEQAKKSTCPSVLFKVVGGHSPTARHALEAMGQFKVDSVYDLLCHTTLK